MKRPLLVFATLTLSCSTATVVNTTYNFDRATDVDFLCLRSENGTITPLPLTNCGLNSADNTSTTGNAHLYAVVTQSERGELAVVDLAAASGTSLIDNSPEIPGYSFIPIGALPTALVSDVRAAGTPSSLWIASTGERAIERLDATRVLTNPRRVSAGTTSIPVNGAPRDLAIDTVNGRTLLYATVPDRSAVDVIDVTDPLNPMDMGFTPITAPSGSGDAGLDGGTTVAAHPLALAVDGETHKVYVSDDRSNQVHVLEGTPLRETARIDVGAPTRALGISGWARRGVTCGLEAADPDHYAQTRYLYAADANTGALLVYDLVRGVKVAANVLPLPNPERRRISPTLSDDRVAISSPVVALVPINTAEYRGLDASGQITVPDACRTLEGCAGAASVGPGYLHGVFMGAVLRDGGLTVIDIDDYDAPARAQSPYVVNATNGYRFVRHAPRASLALTTANLTVSSPAHTTLVRGTQRITVGESNTSPALGCVRPRSATDTTSCLIGNDAGVTNYGIELAPRAPLETNYLPDAGAPTNVMPVPPTCPALDASSDASVDASADVSVPNSTLPADPYALRNEIWTLTYDGVIPGLDLYGAGFGGASTSGALVLDAPSANFCTRGAFAGDTFARDHIVIVGDPTVLPSNASRLTECRQRFGTTTPVNRTFVIREAWQDHLVLDVPSGISADDVRTCFAIATHVEVRAQNQWLVTGTRYGYVSAVRADDTGRCVIDDAKQAEVEALGRRCLTARVPLASRTAPRCLAGRACMGATQGAVSLEATPVFANPFFCVQVFPSPVAEATRDEQFAFSVAGAWDALRVEVGSFPVSSRFLPQFNRLFVVDTQNIGLLEFRTDPLARSRTFN